MSLIRFLDVTGSVVLEADPWSMAPHPRVGPGDVRILQDVCSRYKPPFNGPQMQRPCTHGGERAGRRT